MTPEDRKRLVAARKKLAGLAREYGSVPAIREHLLAYQPKLILLIGESELDKWITEKLREQKDPRQPGDPEQLPLFGFFDGVVVARCEWTEPQYRIYYRRYTDMAEHATTKRDLLAAEFKKKFGHDIGGTAIAS